MKTKRKEIETSNEMEEKYHNIFDSNRDSITIFRIGKEGNPENFIEINPATIALFGYTKKELLSMSIKDIESVPDKTREARINTLIALGQINFETIIKNKKGNLRNIEVKSILINYLNGTAVMNITRDITERKQIEKNIRKTQENLSTILEAIPDLLFEVNLEGRIFYYQAHRKDLLVVHPSEFIKKKFQEVIPAEAAEICLEALQEANEKGWSTGKQYSLDLPQGKHWFELSVSSIKESSNKEMRFILLARDITDRKIAEIAFVENKQNLQTIFDSVIEAIYVMDESGTLIDVNKGAEKMYGYSRQELIGKTPQTLAAPGLNDLDKIKKILLNVFENGAPNSFEFWAVRKNGEVFSKEVVINKCKYSGKDVIIATARDISERKRSEEEIRKSNERFDLIGQATNDAIWEWNLETNTLWANEVHQQLFGLTMADPVPSDEVWVQRLHPEDREQTLQKIKNEMASNCKSFNAEYRLFTENKGWINVYGSTYIDRNKEGKPIRLLGSMQNITERKQAEEKLRESEEKYRGLVEGSPDGIVIYIDDKIAYINNEGIKMLGAKSKTEIIGKPVLQYIHPDSLTGVLQRIEEVVMDNNASATIEERFIDINGVPFDVEIKAIPCIYENKAGVQVIIHNITERKSTEEKIRQLSLAVEQSPVSIIITNTKGEIEYVNPKFTNTSGYTFDEVKGENPRILKSGYTSTNEYNELWQTLTNENDWHGEFQNRKKDGTLYWESASISPIVNSRGVTTHYIAIKEDITHRKNIENELIKAKEKAEESDRLKSSFLANMSHEIRTPMNGILGFTELLKEPKLSDKEQQEYINIIEKSGKRMLNIINDIINISKVESGQIDIIITETNVNEQIEYIHTFFKPEAKHKGIQFNYSKPLLSDKAFIKTDREKLYAILTNLVKNALKFTNEGSIEFGYEKKGAALEFFVKDTGLGISISQKKIIFERFRQANETISRSHEGSGLGLAISKAYVEMLGGKIWVESQEGIGSTFYFTIPYNLKNENNENIYYQKTDNTVTTENKIKNLKVLIVEDDAVSKLLITIAVKPFSKEILKVSTGFEAIEACRNNPDIDLVMMDINMPEMGGYEATKQIREFNKNLVIIAQTANAMQSDRDDAIAAGCTDYISKPINITSLSELIQKYFKK